jgi:hypothetical protein
MLSMIAVLVVSAAAVPSVEYRIERLGSKEILLEGSAPIEPQRLSRFEHSQPDNQVSLSMMLRPAEREDRVTMDLEFTERLGVTSHKWQVTVVLLRGSPTTSDISWGESGWRVRLKVS